MTALGQPGPGGPRIRQDDNDQRWWFVVDPVLIAAALFIAGLGILLVFSATRGPATELEPADTSFLERQTFFAFVGVGLAFATALVDVRRIRALTPLAYGGLLRCWRACWSSVSTSTVRRPGIPSAASRSSHRSPESS